MTADDAMARLEAAHAGSKTMSLGHQFIPITQLKAMKANDLATDALGHSHVRDLKTLGIGREHLDLNVGQISRNHPIYKGQAYDWDRLSRDYDTGGADKPLYVGSHKDHASGQHIEDRLLNGHHRAIMAMEKGRMFVPVTERPKREDVDTGRYQGPPSQARPTRKWEPLLQEHEREHEQASWDRTKVDPVHYGQGVLFNNPGFNDRRSRG